MNLSDEDLDLMLDALLILEERLRDDFHDELHDDDDDPTGRADRLVTIERRQDHTTNLYERVGRALDDRRRLL